jgi:septal ring factor EnvC (AmiA/AmiB activator)
LSAIEQLVDLLHRQVKETDRLRDELARARRHESDAAYHLQRAERERDAAEKKIEEWFDYSQAWHPLIPKRRLKELKAEVPTPYDREIPF